MSHCRISSQKYDDADPLGFTGLPAPWSCPRLNGRNRVFAPASFVVIRTSEFDTTKCTSDRFANANSGSPAGDRSNRYCSTAFSMGCVKSVFSSIVDTGMPLTNSTRSNALFGCFAE
ncbi:hypothetical protein BJ978_002665 [Agromyces terreus]|uniref:Uncharacterized protein n=1 Tax=Agromyces terreus TaxID=424795 RepID=A0A9X2H8K0_9MICO|nr:hypothetical protein [Agromyces terreus]MCP2371989.1 hypothetical protein [Agromyces terreus]